MTALPPVIVEETFGNTGVDDFDTFAQWEAALPVDLTREHSGDTCRLTSPGNNQIYLGDSAVATDAWYNGMVVEWNGEQRRITDYVGASKLATVDALNGSAATFGGTPQAGNAYTVHPVVMKGLGHAHNVNALMTIAGQTTDADAYVWLTAKPGASWRDTATPTTEEIDWNDARLRNDHSPGSTNQRLLQVNTPHTLVERLQIRAGGQERVHQIEANDGITFRDCLIVDSTSNLQRRTPLLTGATFVNCVLFYNSTRTDPGHVISAKPGCTLVNCAVIRSTSIAAAPVEIVNREGNCSFRSCAFYGNWNVFQSGSTGTIEVDKCATSLSSFGTISSGSGNITSGDNTLDMEDLSGTGGDARAKAGGNLESAADVESETDYGGGRVDVFGNARHASAPTIGAFELPSSGGGPIRKPTLSLLGVG